MRRAMDKSSAAIEILKAANPQRWLAFRQETHTKRVEDVNLEGENLERYDFKGMELPNLRMKNCRLEGAVFTKSQIEDAEFTSCAMRAVHFGHARLSGARFIGSDLFQADFNSAKCVGAHFVCTIDTANFSNANLTDADFSGSSAAVGTNFQSATVTNCRIERHTLESMHDYGRLTPGQRMDMEIVDGVATLRASYSGFLQWIHAAALTAFVFPYAYFVLSRWTLARFSNEDGDITLLRALARYVWTGGSDWQTGQAFAPAAFTVFVLSLIYNLLRFVMLWKTKTLELRQTASGLPVRFRLAGAWNVFYQAAKWGLWGNLLLVGYHTYYFLGQRIPVD